ncbi:4078_t:CDS:10, partial [Acaulospora colombiana]
MFPLSQKKRAEEVCYEALKVIASGNGEQAGKARIFLETFNEQIDSQTVQEFWESVRLQNERSKTRNAQLHLNEKKLSIYIKQQFIQVESNVIEEFHIKGDQLLLEFKENLGVMNTLNDSRSKEKRSMDNGEPSKNSKKSKTTNTDEIDSESNDPEESDKKNLTEVKEEYNLKNLKVNNYAENISSGLDYLSEQTNDELNSGISSNYEDEDEENSLDGSSDEEDTVELADISFNSFVDLSSEFKRGMHSWFNDDWIPLKNKALSKINLTVEEFSGDMLEFITKVENNGQPQKHTEIQSVIKMVDPILEIIFSDCQNLVRLMWGETVSQVTNDSKRKIDLCIRTENGTKELSHSECAQKATLLKILKDLSKSLRTNKCILNKYLKNDLPDEALEDTTIFGLQLAALEGQLIGVDLLDEGLYFGFDGSVFEFPAQICSIDVLRQTLEVWYYFK